MCSGKHYTIQRICYIISAFSVPGNSLKQDS
jgi:hypothetical protein